MSHRRGHFSSRCGQRLLHGDKEAKLSFAGHISMVSLLALDPADTATMAGKVDVNSPGMYIHIPPSLHLSLISPSTSIFRNQNALQSSSWCNRIGDSSTRLCSDQLQSLFPNRRLRRQDQCSFPRSYDRMSVVGVEVSKSPYHAT